MTKNISQRRNVRWGTACGAYNFDMGRREDGKFMSEVLRLAKKGEGKTLSNPMVGAIIVKNGKIIARGYHHGFGKPHAEADVLRKAGKRAKGATLYVNLEPCNHFGKTPPCAPAVISAGIARVVCAARDPNKMAQGGIEALRKAGIKVSLGLCEKEARELNEVFYTFHEKKRPFVSLKYAASLDGKMATYARDSKWITNESARAYARRLRGLHQAVIVGIGTVLADNPHLTARTRGMNEPFRIVLDPDLKIPLHSHILEGGRTIVFVSAHASAKKKKDLERKNVRVITFPGSTAAPARILAELGRLGITSVLVEGGGEVLGSFIDAKLADKVYAFFAPVLIGGRGAVTIGGKGAKTVSEALHFKNISVSRFGDNLLVIGSPL